MFGSLITLASWAGTSQAQVAPVPSAPVDEVQQCAGAYEQAQVLRNAGRLMQAEAQLRICVRDVCPDFVKMDCGQWLSDVKREMPSVIFAGEDVAGKELTDIRVFVDDQPLLQALDGRAIELDPGQHQVRFEYQGKSEAQRLIVRQGEKNRVVRVTFRTGIDSDQDGIFDSDDLCPLAAGSVQARGCPVGSVGPGPTESEKIDVKLVGGIAALGVGVAGWVGFAGWGLKARDVVATTLAGCPPPAGVLDTCDDPHVDRMKKSERKYDLLANVSVGVGIAGLATGTLLLVLRQFESAPAPAAALKLDVVPLAGGSVVSLSGRF